MERRGRSGMAPGPRPFREGEWVLLDGEGADPVLAPLRAGTQTLDRSASIDLSALIGAVPGTAFTWLGVAYTALRPSLADRLARLKRGAQIVTGKDAAQIVFRAGLGPGARVAEAGAGSGALTLALAHAVGPTGTVVSYDRRADFLRAARANVAAAGWEERVRFVERDVVADGLDTDALDAVILDLPEPWQVVTAARSALVPGGYLVTYSPTYNQLERSVREMRSAGFGPVDAEEVLVRALHVGDGGTRPDFEMLGHTGFLAFGRRRR